MIYRNKKNKEEKKHTLRNSVLIGSATTAGTYPYLIAPTVAASVLSDKKARKHGRNIIKGVGELNQLKDDIVKSPNRKKNIFKQIYKALRRNPDSIPNKTLGLIEDSKGLKHIPNKILRAATIGSLRNAALIGTGVGSLYYLKNRKKKEKRKNFLQRIVK